MNKQIKQKHHTNPNIKGVVTFGGGNGGVVFHPRPQRGATAVSPRYHCSLQPSDRGFRFQFSSRICWLHPPWCCSLDTSKRMCLGCWRNLHLNRGSDKGGGVVQRILISTRHESSGLQLQNWMHGPFFATTKYREQLDLILKTIQDMHYKNVCIWSWKIAENRKC